MATLQERMNGMRPYFRGIEMYNEALIVKVMFPNKWTVSGSADERIKVTPSEQVANEFFYYASSENTTYEDMFDLIEETISINQEMGLKLKLLGEKVNELRELFSNTKYDDLLTLKFVMEKQKGKKGRPKRKKEQPMKEVEQVDMVTEEVNTEAQ